MGLLRELLGLCKWEGAFASMGCSEGVLQLGEDADRQFAPRSAEVRGAIQHRIPASRLRRLAASYR